MVFKSGVIYLLLAAVLSFLVIKTFSVWRNDYDISVSPAQQQKDPSSAENPARREFRTPPKSAYDEIDRRDLFSETRRALVPVVESVEEVITVEQKIKGKEIRLYGVVLSKDHKKALISNPERGGDASAQLWISQGETVGGLKAVSIEDSAVIFMDGQEKYRVPLYEKNKTRNPVTKTSSSQPNVITTGTSGKPDKVNDNPPKTEPKAPAASEPPASKEEYEIISTPFGEMKRRKN